MVDTTTRIDPMLQIAKRHGIHDPEAYLLANPDTQLTIGSRNSPMRAGNVAIMQKKTITRKEIDDKFNKLKYL